MPGFNVAPTKNFAPFAMIPPELLAQIAAAAFRPPQAMSPPGLNMSAPPPASGLSLGDGMAALGAGLGALRHRLDFLTGQQYRGDPLASAAYGSQRPAYPADVIARGGWIGGGV